MPLAGIPPITATAPITTAVIRATRTSSAGSVSPRRSTLAYTSWAKRGDWR